MIGACDLLAKCPGCVADVPMITHGAAVYHVAGERVDRCRTDAEQSTLTAIWRIVENAGHAGDALEHVRVLLAILDHELK